jgi:hypothetical protein
MVQRARTSWVPALRSGMKNAAARLGHGAYFRASNIKLNGVSVARLKRLECKKGLMNLSKKTITYCFSILSG